MATRTATPAASGVQPKGHHQGLNVTTVEYSLTAAVSAGDIINMAKIPAGSEIVGLVANFAAGSGNAFPVSMGIGGGAANTFGSASAAAYQGFVATGTPYTVSVSDAATNRWQYLYLTVGTVTSATATGKLSLTILSTNNG